MPQTNAATFESVYRSVSNLSFRGLLYQEIPGEGHCLFHAIGLYLGQDAAFLRKIVAAHMEENIQELQPYFAGTEADFRGHITAIREGNEWGDNIEIEIIQRLTNRPIIIIRPNANPTILDNVESYQGEPIFIYYNDHNHYDAFVLEEGYRANDILSAMRGELNQGRLITYKPQTQLGKHSPTFRYVRFSPIKVRQYGDGVQISLLEIKYDGEGLTGATATAPSTAYSLGHEKAENVVDSTLKKKWFTYAGFSEGNAWARSYHYNNTRPILILDFSKPVQMDGYTFATANDCDHRDPVSWKIEGSNDNLNWQLLDERTDYPTPTTRHTRLPDLTFQELTTTTPAPQADTSTPPTPQLVPLPASAPSNTVASTQDSPSPNDSVNMSTTTSDNVSALDRIDLIPAGLQIPLPATEPIQVLVWFANPERGTYGHVALYLGDNTTLGEELEDKNDGERKIYISFYPDQEHLSSRKAFYSGVPGMLADIKQDYGVSRDNRDNKKHIEYFRDEQYEFYSLSTDTIKEEFRHSFPKGCKYAYDWAFLGSSIFGRSNTQNCAGLAYKLLHKAGIGKLNYSNAAMGRKLGELLGPTGFIIFSAWMGSGTIISGKNLSITFKVTAPFVSGIVGGVGGAAIGGAAGGFIDGISEGKCLGDTLFVEVPYKFVRKILSGMIAIGGGVLNAIFSSIGVDNSTSHLLITPNYMAELAAIAEKQERLLYGEPPSPSSRISPT